MTDGQTVKLRWVTEGKGSVSERTSGPVSLEGESCERGIKSDNLSLRFGNPCFAYVAFTHTHSVVYLGKLS